MQSGRGDDSKVAISVKTLCELLNINKSTIKRRLDRGDYRHTNVQGKGGSQYRIELDSLPPEAQYRFWAQHLTTTNPPADRRAALEKLNLDEDTEREIARLAGITRKPRPLQPLPPTLEEHHLNQLAFEKLHPSAIEEAQRRMWIMRDLSLTDPTLPMLTRYRQAAAKSGESVRTLQRWQQRTRHLEFRDWAHALAPTWSGGRPKKEFSEDAWNFIAAEWLVQSQPALLPIYRRAKREGKKHQWVIPSYRTVKRRVDAISEPVKVYRRQGHDALAKLYPGNRRDYRTLDVNAIWWSDGRMGDLWCVWPDGHVGRPILVAWQEVRTRKVLGWSVGKVESAELVRLAFRDAARRSNAIPHEAYIDNGRAFASKQITGGQATRNRFKVNAADPYGLLTIFGISAIWATPHHGQAKGIESYWNTIAEEEKCAAFTGAYCGRSTDTKPEECDPKKAVPIAHYIAFVRETIEVKNAQEHRGDSMDGRSPDDLYSELIETTPVRRPTAEQLRLCLMAVEQVKLDRDSAITNLGNRYFSEQLAQLAHRGPYTARFNPDDASEPIAVYDGERFICEAPLLARTGFRDMAAAKDHIRERNRFKKAQKQQAKAYAGMVRAERSWEGERSSESDPKTLRDLATPSPKIARLVRPPLAPQSGQTQTRAEIDAEQREFLALRNKGLDQEAKRRANGGD